MGAPSPPPSALPPPSRLALAAALALAAVTQPATALVADGTPTAPPVVCGESGCSESGAAGLKEVNELHE